MLSAGQRRSTSLWSVVGDVVHADRTPAAAAAAAVVRRAAVRHRNDRGRRRHHRHHHFPASTVDVHFAVR